MLSATKQAIRIKLATTVGLCYVTLTLTLQTLYGLSTVLNMPSIAANIFLSSVIYKLYAVIAICFQPETDDDENMSERKMTGFGVSRFGCRAVRYDIMASDPDVVYSCHGTRCLCLRMVQPFRPR